ncbi:anti-RecBCD protein 1 [Salmonella enterica subsp. enterica serovar Typhimurium]|nr:anti-RecBCD protein 1 [Salmonella enterica subsp. enterica serovar Typhimurium]
MRRLNITPAEMESVCGRMVACRAAEHLGLNINQFYYIAKKLSLKTAFVKPNQFYYIAKKLSLKTAFVKQDGAKTKTKKMQALISSGYTQRNVAKILGRSEESVKSRLSRLRKK